MTAADTSRRFLRTPVQDLCPHADDKLEKLEESFHTAGLCEGDSSIIHQPLLEGSSPFMRTTEPAPRTHCTVLGDLEDPSTPKPESDSGPRAGSYFGHGSQ